MGKLVPDWPAPANVHTFFTDRAGGCSNAPYDSLNFGLHVGDDASVVQRNRESIDVPSKPAWLQQAHTNTCINADIDSADQPADASFTRNRDRVLAIMVADCLPVVFSSVDGSVVAIAHAGWRGLADGVLAATVSAMGESSVLAWMGPAIGPCHYTVGEDVRTRFRASTGFTEQTGNQYSMDLYAIATEQLQALGVEVHGGGLCTYCDSSRFFSYRRDGVTGRMAGFIWMD